VKNLNPRCVLGAAALAALLAAAQTPAPALNRVVSLKGVLTLHRGQQQERALRVNDAVETGDELVTSANSKAVIRAADGTTVRIFPDSRVVFSPPSSTLNELLHLFLGSVKIHIEKVSGRPNPHKMTTPTAVIAVRGTTFSVFVERDGATLVAVDDGVVSVANISQPAEEVILRRGERSWVRPGQPPSRAQRFRGPSERANTAQADNGGGPMGSPGMQGGPNQTPGRGSRGRGGRRGP
jgi:hypothetical protein